MLDVTYQAMEMMVATMGAGQGASNQSGGQTKAEGKSDFDSMIEQKQQEAKGQQTQKSGTDAPKDEAEPAVKDEEIPDEQYAMVAAMMLQMQPVIEYTDPTVEMTEEPVQELVLDAVVPEAELPGQDAVQDAAAQIVTEQPVEETAAPVEIAPQEMQRDSQQETENSAPQESQVREDGQVRTQREDAPAPENVRWETPVFGNVDAAPVKVAAPQEEPLDLQAPDAAEDLAGRIEDLLADEGMIDSRVEFTLSPESLGKITVQITHGVDGSLHVLLGASTERAAAMLVRHTDGLQNLLSSNGRTQAQIEVRGNEESQRQFFNPNGENNQGRQQQGQQRRQQPEHRTQDFVQQLRLGLIGRDSDE